MRDFTQKTKYNPNANYSQIKIGADCPVLEVELNEMQEISQDRIRKLANTFIGNGISGEGTYTYVSSKGLLTIENEYAIVDGISINIDKLSLIINSGSAYLKVWEEEITYNSKVKYLGNAQSTKYVENTLIDDRLGEETSRRLQVKYDLVSNNTDTKCHYLKLGEIKNNKFTITCNLYNGYRGANRCDKITLGDNQTLINLSGTYRMNTNSLLVFADNTPLHSGEDYTELTPSCIRLNNSFPTNTRLFIYYTNAIIIRDNPNNHNTSHMRGGDDALDISDLEDKNNIINRILATINAIQLDCGSFLDDSDDPNAFNVYNCGTF